MAPEPPANLPSGDVDAGAVEDYRPDGTRVVRVGTTDVLVARLGDTERFAAIDNACPHAGAPLDWSPLRHEDGDVRVICPAHGWCVSVCDGSIVGTSHRTRTYAVTVLDGRVRIAAGEERTADTADRSLPSRTPGPPGRAPVPRVEGSATGVTGPRSHPVSAKPDRTDRICRNSTGDRRPARRDGTTGEDGG